MYSLLPIINFFLQSTDLPLLVLHGELQASEAMLLGRVVGETHTALHLHYTH